MYIDFCYLFLNYWAYINTYIFLCAWICWSTNCHDFKTGTPWFQSTTPQRYAAIIRQERAVLLYTFSEEKRLIFILQIQSIPENYRFKWIEVIDKCFERFATVVAVPVLKFRCCCLNASEKFSVTLVYNRILNSVSISDGRRFGCRSYVGGSLQEGG